MPKFMRKRILIFQAISMLILTAGLLGNAFGDHYDNQTAEERPKKKKKPLTKYEKSEYISKSQETGNPYLYTEDGDPIGGAKSKKGKGHAKGHSHGQPASGEQKPKKQFKKMSFDEPDRGHQKQAMPSPGPQAESQTDASGGQGPSVHVMP